MQRSELLNLLNDLLQPWAIKDYCPNGLQVEGKDNITKVVTGVTASQALIDAAIVSEADAILVHHGYFWKGEPPQITGMKKRRIKALLQHDINLIGYHLPLDVHPEVGNNAQLGKLLQLHKLQTIDPGDNGCVVMSGCYGQPKALDEVVKLIDTSLNRQPMVVQVNDKPIKRVAWCTGGGQGYIDAAAAYGADLFITGEVSEQTIHSARELNINFIAAGHHATERYGIKALGEYLSANSELNVEFIDIDNPA